MVSFTGVCSRALFLAKALEPRWWLLPPCPADIAAQLFDFIPPNFTRSDSKSILYAQDHAGCLNNHSHPDVLIALGYLLTMWVGAGYITP